MRHGHTVVLGLLISCATAEPTQAPKEQWEKGTPVALSPTEAVEEAYTPATCEAAAEQRLATDADGGWEMLKLCAKRWLYTDLRHLLEGPWVAEFKRRDDAPLFLGQLIALRGGDAESDADLLRAKGIGIYSLGAVAEHPRAQLNSYVLVRARVASRFTASDQTPTLVLAEIGRGLARPPPSVPAASVADAAPGASPQSSTSDPAAVTAADPAALLRQLQQMQASLDRASAPPAPVSAPEPAVVNPRGVNLSYEDSGLTAVASMARGAKLPPEDANFLFVAKIVGEVRAPDVDGQTVKGYEKEPVVPSLSILRYYALSGVAMY